MQRLTDSFTPRGIKEVCTGAQRLTRDERVGDAHGALRWLRQQSFVARDRIGVISGERVPPRRRRLRGRAHLLTAWRSRADT